eukprot:380540_1
MGNCIGVETNSTSLSSFQWRNDSISNNSWGLPGAPDFECCLFVWKSDERAKQFEALNFGVDVRFLTENDCFVVLVLLSTRLIDLENQILPGDVVGNDSHLFRLLESLSESVNTGDFICPPLMSHLASRVVHESKVLSRVFVWNGKSAPAIKRALTIARGLELRRTLDDKPDYIARVYRSPNKFISLKFALTRTRARDTQSATATEATYMSETNGYATVWADHPMVRVCCGRSSISVGSKVSPLSVMRPSHTVSRIHSTPSQIANIPQTNTSNVQQHPEFREEYQVPSRPSHVIEHNISEIPNNAESLDRVSRAQETVTTVKPAEPFSSESNVLATNSLTNYAELQQKKQFIQTEMIGGPQSANVSQSRELSPQSNDDVFLNQGVVKTSSQSLNVSPGAESRTHNITTVPSIQKRTSPKDAAMSRESSELSSSESSESTDIMAEYLSPAQLGSLQAVPILSLSTSEAKMDVPDSYESSKPLSQENPPLSTPIPRLALSKSEIKENDSESVPKLAISTPSTQTNTVTALKPLQPLALPLHTANNLSPFPSNEIQSTDLELSADEHTSLELEPSELQMKAAKLEKFSGICSEILDFLFVGGDRVARDRTLLRSKGITSIVNCARDICDNYFPDDFLYLG